MKRTPALFIAHGTPMNALENNPFTQDWHNVCQDLGKPNAIVVFSAHWETESTQITHCENPDTLNDFTGFPAALRDLSYPCPGSPQIAKNIQQQLIQSGFNAALNSQRGLDHGSWVILHRLFPTADIPVLQISLSTELNSLEAHFKLAQSLRNFREQGILFIGSGNIVHNIPLWRSMLPDDDFQWAVDSDRAVFHAIENGQLDRLFDVDSLPSAHLAVPTIEHYLPLIYTLGLAFDNEPLRHSRFAEHSLASACSRSIRIG